MSQQVTLEDLLNATSSQGSGSGPTPCVAPDGLMIDRSGPAPALVRVFRLPGRELALTIQDICGLHGSNLSKSVGHQLFSGNKSRPLE